MPIRTSHAVAAGAAVLGIVVAAPALAGAGQAPDPSGQPPAGSSVEKKTDFRPDGQPPAGTKAPKTTDFRPGKQPVNRNPQPPTEVVEVRDDDEGVKNLPPTKDGGAENAPATRDRGAR